MNYAPTKKVIAGIVLAVIGTIVLIASGDASLVSVSAVWAPVAATYAKSD